MRVSIVVCAAAAVSGFRLTTIAPGRLQLRDARPVMEATSAEETEESKLSTALRRLRKKREVEKAETITPGQTLPDLEVDALLFGLDDDDDDETQADDEEAQEGAEGQAGNASVRCARGGGPINRSSWEWDDRAHRDARCLHADVQR